MRQAVERGTERPAEERSDVDLGARRDPVVARTRMRAANLTRPPTALLAPDLVLRVLRAGRR